MPGESGRLLILACSQRKRPEPGLLPAIQRDTGPVFHISMPLQRKRHSAAGACTAAAWSHAPQVRCGVDVPGMCRCRRVAVRLSLLVFVMGAHAHAAGEAAHARPADRDGHLP